VAHRYKPTWIFRSSAELWIDHATVVEDDLQRMRDVEELTLWNVRFPEGFLARLKRLWFLDLRGGSASDLRVVDGCTRLRGLVVNQVRGLQDLSAISSLANLEFLSLYGLAQMEALPPLRALESLRRVEIGQMRRLEDWSPLAELTALEELLLLNLVTPDERVMRALARSRRLKTFYWYSEDGVAWSKVEALEAIFNRPRTRTLFARDWFGG
jgi:hypothetical protein